MRKPNRRVLPTIIGVSVLTTLAANTAVLIARGPDGDPAPSPQEKRSRYDAASGSTSLSPGAVAPLGKRLTPHVLVAAPSALPAATIAKIRGAKGVKGVEVVDAVQGMVAGKRVGLMGVDPSTFRNYTPKPTAQRTTISTTTRIRDSSRGGGSSGAFGFSSTMTMLRGDRQQRSPT